jgi:hypothetical protein
MRADKVRKLRPGKPNPLNEGEMTYILKHYQNTTVPKMARYLHRTEEKLHQYLEENKLPAFNPNNFGRKRKAPKVSQNGFFQEHARKDWIM